MLPFLRALFCNVRPVTFLFVAVSAACGNGSTDDPGAGPGDPPPDAPVGLELVVDDGARACEVLLADPEARIDTAFGEAVEVRVLRRGDRLALAFAHRADADIAPGTLRLEARGGADDVVVESGQCFDRAGQPIAGAVALADR